MSYRDWYDARRLDYIDDMLVLHGKVTTDDVRRYFGISRRRVMLDWRAYKAIQPNAAYDTMLRAYVRKEGFRSVRHTTPDRRRAWDYF
jgi:hypothetical protein